MNRSNLEKETIITFNEAEPTANVYTCSKRLLKKLAQLKESHPSECTMETEYRERKDEEPYARSYNVPKKWIKVNAPAKQNLTPEQLAERTERLREMTRLRMQKKADS